MYFHGASHQTMKFILNTKTQLKNILLFNLINIIFNYNICFGIKVDQAKIRLFVIQWQKLLIPLKNSFCPFYQITFSLSNSYMLLIDKENESCRNSIQFERNAMATTIKNSKREKKKNIFTLILLKISPAFFIKSLSPFQIYVYY